jgi:hypothetical protein
MDKGMDRDMDKDKDKDMRSGLWDMDRRMGL